jgi:predicted metal-dependent hydrolase
MLNSDDFKKYILLWASELNVDHKIKEIHIRKMKTKWASCSTRGRLTFDTTLLEKDFSTIDHIIIHELLHLRYKNHGKMFKALLKSIISRKPKTIQEFIKSI